MGVDPTAPAAMVRVTTERLVDEIDTLHRQVWLDEHLDREELRGRVGRVMLLATAVLDTLPAESGSPKSA